MTQEYPAIGPLVLFGASTPSGAAFRELAVGQDLWLAGRSCPADWPQQRFLACDLTTTSPAALSALPPGCRIVSFAPLWHLAPVVAALLSQARDEAAPVAVVACSSSSVLSKRFAANRFDKDLVERLLLAESTLEQACRSAAIPGRIVRPTLIYGTAGGYGDRNLSVLLGLMRRLPLLPIPCRTGLRQPIHARQLAAVVLRLAEDPALAPSPLNLGGDDTLSYGAMLRALRNEALARQPRDPAGRCRLLPLAMPLFHLLAAPLLPWRPKLFEAVLRIEADLAGFTPAHSLLETPPEPFPVRPLAG